jgi:hypothetical protein
MSRGTSAERVAWEIARERVTAQAVAVTGACVLWRAHTNHEHYPDQ